MKNLTWQNPEQLFVAQELINKVKSKCCGIKVNYRLECDNIGCWTIYIIFYSHSYLIISICQILSYIYSLEGSTVITLWLDGYSSYLLECRTIWASSYNQCTIIEGITGNLCIRISRCRSISGSPEKVCGLSIQSC